MFYYEFCEIFKNTYFEEHLRVTASVIQPVKLPRHFHFSLLRVST